MNQNRNTFDLISQFAIPALTIGAQVAIAAKYPQWGLIINMSAQPFWFYSGWKAYKQAGQVGIVVTTVIFAVVTGIGIMNYWVFR